MWRLLLAVPLLFLLACLLWRRITPRINRTERQPVREAKIGFPLGHDPYHAIEPLPHFEWSTTSPMRNAPLKPIYHLTMALENISLSELLVMDNTYVDRMRIRRETLDENQEATLQCNSVCEPAACELYNWLVKTYLPTRFPRTYKATVKGLLNTASNEFLPYKPATAMAALRTLGEHVDTDFLILLPSSQADDGSPIYHLQAFVTCFPAGFSLREKLGLPLSGIHTPVPGYKAKLEKSMDRFFARLECGKAVKRSNWTITTTPDLFNERGLHLYADGQTEHHESVAANKNAEDLASSPNHVQASVEKQKSEVVIERCRLRSERQTLFRLPKTKALVFSFKTYVYMLEDVKKEGYAEQLIEAMEGLAKGNVPEIDFYKRGVVWRDPVIEYLRS